jgi:D-hydroxyproline dehydrogenase subunit alpha
MQADVAIVGAGPAGIAAAVAAAEAGASVVVIDEYNKPGGQFFKRSGEGFSVARQRRTREHERGEALRAKLVHPRIRVLSRALAWGRLDGVLMIYHDGRSEAVHAKSLVIATGAHDRPVAFPGWTLPGVMTAGAAQTIAKTQWVKPARRMLLAGAGPFLLPVSQSLLRADVSIAALVEMTRPLDWLPHGAALWRQWPRFAEVYDYKRELHRSCVPTIYGHKVVRALGKDKVEAAVIAQVDQEWRAVPGTERTLEVDGIAVGYGFLPNIELAVSCGCALRYDAHARAWFVRCSDDMATSVPGIFVAGEVNAIAGASVALVEGEIAGEAAARHAGVVGAEANAERRRALSRQRVHLYRLADALNVLFGPRPGLWDYLGGDITICRCEEVDAGEIAACIDDGCSSLKAVKDWTRAGMGLCQGRMCRGMIGEMVAMRRSVDLKSIPYPRVRPPIKPVPISALLESEETTT